MKRTAEFLKKATLEVRRQNEWRNGGHHWKLKTMNRSCKKACEERKPRRREAS